jgi:hypothetical protein
MYKKFIKVKISPKLNSRKIIDFVVKNISMFNSSVEIRNLTFCGKKEQTSLPQTGCGWTGCS